MLLSQLTLIQNKTRRMCIGLVASLLLMVTSFSRASDFQFSRSITVRSLPLEASLGRQVIPLVRPYLSRDGHLGIVESTNQIVVAASPETLDKLAVIFADLNEQGLSPEQLKIRLQSQLILRKASSMQTRLIPLERLQPKELIPAIRVLVSKQGHIQVKNRGLEITDYPDYLSELTRLINQLEKSSINL